MTSKTIEDGLALKMGDSEITVTLAADQQKVQSEGSKAEVFQSRVHILPGVHERNFGDT